MRIDNQTYAEGATPTAISGRRHLYDVSFRQQERTRLGDRRFSVAGPRLWNSLPAELRQPDAEIGQVRRLLKTFLFERDCGA